MVCVGIINLIKFKWIQVRLKRQLKKPPNLTGAQSSISWSLHSQFVSEQLGLWFAKNPVHDTVITPQTSSTDLSASSLLFLFQSYWTKSSSQREVNKKRQTVGRTCMRLILCGSIKEGVLQKKLQPNLKQTRGDHAGERPVMITSLSKNLKPQ